jgi:hypothetical protein
VRASKIRSGSPGIAAVLAYIDSHPEVGKIQKAIHEGEVD